jgi:hypothetical protein
MRDATVGALASVPAPALPAVPMATPVDPILTAIERDCIAYVGLRRITQQDRWTEGSTRKRSRSHTNR